MPNQNPKDPARKSKSAERSRTPNAQRKPTTAAPFNSILPTTPTQLLTPQQQQQQLQLDGSPQADESSCDSASDRQSPEHRNSNAQRRLLQANTSDHNAFYFDLPSSNNSEASAILAHKKHSNNSQNITAATSTSALALALAAATSQANAIDAELAGSVSPHEHELCLNLASTCSLGGSSGGGWDANNHRIYSIDELSEVSGRSDAVLAHERMQLEKVQQILNIQEQQAQKGRPVSRRGIAQQNVVPTATTTITTTKESKVTTIK